MAATPRSTTKPRSTGRTTAARRKVTPAKTTPAKPTAARRAAPTGADLDAAILRELRRFPNTYVELGPLVKSLGVEPTAMQLAVERLAGRRMLVVPFVEPGTAGGAILAEGGLRWLIEREGGKPKDVPVAFQPAKGHVRAGDEAARLPRAQVYGVRRVTD